MRVLIATDVPIFKTENLKLLAHKEKVLLCIPKRHLSVFLDYDKNNM